MIDERALSGRIALSLPSFMIGDPPPKGNETKNNPVRTAVYM